MVSDDVILEQVEFTYDPAGNVIQTVTRQRYHNAPDTQIGPLNDPSTTPKARVTYSTAYPDALGRTVATVEYGTNGGTTLTRPSTIPARSDTVLVNTTTFDDAGNAAQTVDPAGMVTRVAHDDAGRQTEVIENYQSGSSSSSSSSSSSGGGCEPSDDANRTTRFTYTPDGQQATLVAVNARTGDQTTTWTYGTTLANSDIASSQLLRSVAYPDSTGGSDLVLYSYNRLGERTTLTDQRGCVHTYERDKLGRLIHDRVTTLGTGVDGAIRRLSTSYDVRGLTSKLTSWNNASVNSGDVVNECLFVFNSFVQLIADYQNHSGAVNTSTTPKVQYGYANGSDNTIRPITLTYPNGRVITYDYGTADGINDAASRIASLIDDDDTHLVDYSFLGLGIIVVVDYTEPDVKYTLVDLSGTNDPDTGDIYSGLDRFGRVKDCRWYDYGHTTDTVRLKYGYDRAGNRLWRADLVAQSLSKDFDELYSYDGLHRLKDMQRGLLNGSYTAVTNPTFGQCWSLDPTSNWHGFKEAETGGSWTLDQSRSANTVNETTGITNWTGPTWVTPAYDAAGNTTTIPQPADPTESYTGTYDAWNRLVTLADDATDDTVQENQYDARNFQTVRKDYSFGVLAETRHLYYTSRWQSVEERVGSSPNSADAERQFVWGHRYIDDLVLRDRDTNDDGTHDERLYCLQDANWNVVALINTSAAAEERYLYSPFGWPIILDASMSTIRTSSDFAIECLFTGQRFDWTTMMHLFRMRWLDSTMGRFASRDALAYVDGSSTYAGYFVPSNVDTLGTYSNSTWQWLPTGGFARFIDCPICVPPRWRIPMKPGNPDKDAFARPRDGLGGAVRDACLCIAKAYELMLSYPDNVSNYYDVFRLPQDFKSLFRKKSTIERLKGQLKPAMDACKGTHRKPLIFQCTSYCLGERGTDAYVPWDSQNDEPIGGTIFLCSSFYNQRNPSPSILIHEMGRLYVGLGAGDPNKKEWGDVYLWDDLVGSLCTHYDSIRDGERYSFQ